MKSGKHTTSNLKKKVKSSRQKQLSVETLYDGLISSDKSMLARAITLIESSRDEDFEKSEQLITKCLSVKNESLRIGITGVPGVGKSTFIEAFGAHLTHMDKKVAVLAVDPSSSFTKGSILGDKTRMELLSKDENAFIRPSPASDSLGGVTRKTRETIILCEAAGYDTILVETVGVGQSETAVHSMVDFFLLLKLAGAGDELQGIKRGIMEMADAIIINKADGNNLKSVKLAQTEFQRALHLYPPKANAWTPKVLNCSALKNIGIAEVWKMMAAFSELTKANGHFEKNRAAQNKNWFLQSVDALLKHRFYADTATKAQLKVLTKAVEANKISPFAAANQLVNRVK